MLDILSQFEFRVEAIGLTLPSDICANSKWFEPRSISSSHSVIVRVRVVLKRTVFGD